MSDMEAWRTVPDTNGEYEVSDKGRVRSVARERYQKSQHGSPMTRNLKPKLLKPSNNGSGYLSVQICCDGRQGRRYVHRMVLEAFVGPPPSGEHECAHWNGDRSDNRLENLRWATPRENKDDARRHGTLVGKPKTHCPKGHPRTGDNVVQRGGDDLCLTCAREKQRQWRGSKPTPSRRRSLPTAVKAAVIAAAQGICPLCQKQTDEWDVDHILPLSLGGSDAMVNLQAICRSCHTAKTADEAGSDPKQTASAPSD